jgi:hypothetical protein
LRIFISLLEGVVFISIFQISLGNLSLCFIAVLQTNERSLKMRQWRAIERFSKFAPRGIRYDGNADCEAAV